MMEGKKKRRRVGNKTSICDERMMNAKENNKYYCINGEVKTRTEN